LIWFIARWAALSLTPSWLASAVAIACSARLSTVPDWRAAAFIAAAALGFGPGDLDAGADVFGAGDLTAGAELLAVADGPGLPDDVEPDAKAAAGRAISTAAVTPAAASRRLGTGMTRSFMVRMHASPAAPPKTGRPVTLKEPKKCGAPTSLPNGLFGGVPKIGRVATTRELLLAERARVRGLAAALDREFAGIAAAASEPGTDDEHDPEGATLAFERQHTAALLARARDQIAEIDAAIGRLDEGTYGTCVRCGQPVGQDRLAARPAAATCVRCAR
jgi:DnaK suppressor protein